MLFEKTIQELAIGSEYRNIIAPHWGESADSMPSEAPVFSVDWYFEVLSKVDINDKEVIDALQWLLERMHTVPSLKMLFWHAHRTLCDYDFKDSMALRNWPSLDSFLGKYAGMFYLLTALSAAGKILQTFNNLHIPESYAFDCLRWLAGSIEIYHLSHDNFPGQDKRQTYWVRHYADGRLFRLGRLEFMRRELDKRFPLVYRNRSDGSLLALCGEAWKLDVNGWRLPDDDDKKTYVISSLKGNASTIVGIPISQDGRALVDEKTTLSLDRWEKVMEPGYFALDVHIPGGGKMTLEAVKDSFAQAIDFYARYFPNQPFIAFICISWLLNPDFMRLLPQSNIAKFMAGLHLFPCVSTGKDGMFFIFGNEDIPANQLPKNNPVQKVMAEILQKNESLRCGGMFLMKDEVRK